MFELENIKLEFEDAVVDLIVDTAFDLKLGARGLRSICEALMLDYMYEVPGNSEIKNITITAENASAKMESVRLKNYQAA